MNLEVYCDESRSDYFHHPPAESGSYALIGGVWIQAEKRSIYKGKIKKLRNIHSVLGEFKWNRVCPARQKFYRDIIKFFFRSEARFRAILLPAERLDALKFHQADNELMFYKFYYQLLHHWIEPFNRYHIFLDLKTNRLNNRINTLKEVLRNSSIASEITDVQALPSKDLDLLQLADILIGAVGYHFHGLNTSTAKNTILQEIEAHIGHPITPTNHAEEKFNIFLFSPEVIW